MVTPGSKTGESAFSKLDDVVRPGNFPRSPQPQPRKPGTALGDFRRHLTHSPSSRLAWGSEQGSDLGEASKERDASTASGTQNNSNAVNSYKWWRRLGQSSHYSKQIVVAAYALAIMLEAHNCEALDLAVHSHPAGPSFGPGRKSRSSLSVLLASDGVVGLDQTW